MRDSPFSQDGRAGVYRQPAVDVRLLAAAAGHLDFSLLSADLSAAKTLAGALGKLGEALHFPEWYGGNLDALHDCLTDSDWQGPDNSKGVIVALTGLDALRSRHPGDFTRLIEVLQSACETWRHDGFPFWVLVETGDTALPLLPAA